MRQHPFLTDLGFTALNGVHHGVLRASEGHIGGSFLGIGPDFTVTKTREANRTGFVTSEEPVNPWPQVLRAYWPYGSDQRCSPRDIPHVLLEHR